jgi:glycosyltransferase involved in cell wall biosynthesis
MAPYRFPLFRAIASQPGLDLTVWFMSRSARNRKWRANAEDLGFSYRMLPSIEFNYVTADLFTYVLNYTFPWAYSRKPFDVLISAGWLDFASQSGFLLSKLLRRKFILWSESTANEPSWRRSLASPLVKTMVGGADACISVGTRSKHYLRMLGAQEADVFTAFSTVDVAHFRRLSHQTRPNRARLKAELGITRGRVVLYCGQFIERKGLRQLLDAFARIKREYDDVALVLVGYGPMLEDLRLAAQERGLSDVHFVGHVEVAEMPALYTVADIFVLPSLEETWGLVVNEAMACGLPVIVSDRVGSAPDLVREGSNGFVVPAGESGPLAERCLQVLKDEPLRAQFAACSTQLIEGFTPERAAEGFVEAVHHVTRRS